MRSIGEIKDQVLATNFCGYLNGISIPAEIEQEEPEGLWTIWVHNEDMLDVAKTEFNLFQQNSTDPKYGKIAKEAAEKQKIQEKANAKVRAKEKKLAKRIHGTNSFPVTYALMGISIVTFLLMEAGSSLWIWFLMNDNAFKGQIWRFLTPIFLHFGVLHIAFNMLWLYDLGRLLENKFSSLFLILFVVIVGIGSNLCQVMVNPQTAFGGMSGLVYGLLGFVWMKSRYAPEAGLYIHPSTVTFMMIWLIVGLSGIFNVANGCHVGGLMIGTLWGYLSATVLRRR